jgi:hypothetical protein
MNIRLFKQRLPVGPDILQDGPEDIYSRLSAPIPMATLVLLSALEVTCAHRYRLTYLNRSHIERAMSVMASCGKSSATSVPIFVDLGMRHLGYFHWEIQSTESPGDSD